MPLLSNRSLRGMERGKEIGVLEKARSDIQRVLQIRLGRISSQMESSLSRISDVSLLDELLTLAVTVSSLEEFQQSLEKISCSSSKLHIGKGLKPLVTKLSEKSLCNLNARQLTVSKLKKRSK